MRRLLVGGMAGLTLVLLWAAPAAADITGNCTATMKGIPIKGRSHTDTSKAIAVDAQETLTVAAESTTAIDSYDVKMEFAGFKWNVASGQANGNTWSKVVKVETYATFGVGLYKVYGVSNGSSPCTGAALVKVGGKFPLTTVAGAVGAVLGVLGLLGSAAGIRKGGNANKVPKGSHEAFDRNYRQQDGARYRVDPIRYVDDIVSSPCPGVYVDCLEGVQRAGGGWNEVETICFQTPAQPRDVVSFICKWG